MGDYLKAFIQKELENWCEFIDFAVFSYNISCHTATGYSPFELVYARICELPTEITNKRHVTYNYESYVDELRNKMKTYHDLAKENLIKAKETNKKFYDKSRDKQTLSLNKNDLVLILKPKKNFKFEAPYDGPYRVIKEIGLVTVLIQKGKKTVKIHKDRLKLVSTDFEGKVPPLIE